MVVVRVYELQVPNYEIKHTGNYNVQFRCTCIAYKMVVNEQVSLVMPEAPLAEVIRSVQSNGTALRAGVSTLSLSAELTTLAIR